MSSMGSQIQEKIQEEKREVAFEFFAQMVSLFFSLSEKSVKEEYELVLHQITHWEENHKEDISKALSAKISHLHSLLLKAVWQWPISSIESNRILEEIEALMSIIHPHDEYRRVH